jgi:hypothetical protein
MKELFIDTKELTPMPVNINPKKGSTTSEKILDEICVDVLCDVGDKLVLK